MKLFIFLNHHIWSSCRSLNVSLDKAILRVIIMMIFQLIIILSLTLLETSRPTYINVLLIAGFA